MLFTLNQAKSGPKVSATVGSPCRRRARVTNAKNKICFTAPAADALWENDSLFFRFNGALNAIGSIVGHNFTRA